MDLNIIVYSVVLLGVMGLLFGLILALASQVFKVDTDERLEPLTEALPGANCGGCGFAGCGAYAAAVIAGTAPIGACPVGGAAVTEQTFEDAFDRMGIHRRVLSRTLEDAGTLSAPIVPWGVATLYVMEVLGCGTEYIPYCWFIFIVPIG